MFKKPNPKQNFYELESEVLKFWKSKNILDKSIQQRPKDKSKTFYDGPITANGSPHHGHMITFAMKDLYPRYWTMKGYRVDRSLGWDCQGIPVEYEVEKKLGFKEKKDIEAYGIAKFNELCRQSVLEFKDKIIELEEMMGRLTNTDEEYYTMDSKFIESIWWSLKELYEKDLLYEGFKVVPYSTRAGTTLSNAEVALGGYKKFVDPAITVKFPLKEEPKTMLLAWTTTPWTMPGNLGLAVGAEIDYVKAKVGENIYIVAKDLVSSVFGEESVEITSEMKGSELIGKEYMPPFDFYAGKENAHKIYEGSHVTTDSGTGIVHLAPYGAEDNDIFQKVGIESFDYLNDQGDFKSDIAPYADMYYRKANTQIIEDLKAKDLLFRHEEYEHEMPMCWRTNTPLIYKPITSWYIKMSSLRTELVENNNKINWTPAHVKEGRFGNWLAEIKDWGISRSRYWGTPLPIWKSESGKIKIIGGYDELEQLSGVRIDDPHRPYIDDVTFEIDGEKYTRILDVLDVWYDSGSMPFARLHYPFENQDKFKTKFPAQYIAESVDQTRGWFYSLHAIATSLFGDIAFENVVMSGFVLDDKGVKLSKSKGNYSEPTALVKDFGADTIRANFFTTPIVLGEDTTISPKTLKIKTQEFVLPLWNIYSFLSTYANIHTWTPTEELAYNPRKNFDDVYPWNHIPFGNIDDELNAWMILRLQQTIKEVTDNLEIYQTSKAMKSIQNLIEDTSKWFIRSSRDRFADGESQSIEILYYVFVETLKLLAPFMPFVTEHIYKEIVSEHLQGDLESIHLTDYPEADSKFLEDYASLENEMNFLRRICELGHELRVQNQLKVRQPLSELVIETLNESIPTILPWMKEMLKKELNVKEVIEKISLTESENIKLNSDDSLKVKVGLNTLIDESLKAEGLLREISRAIQSQRKKQGLNQGDKVELRIFASSEVRSLIENNVEDLKTKVNANSIELVSEMETGISLPTEEGEIKFEIVE